MGRRAASITGALLAALLLPAPRGAAEAASPEPPPEALLAELPFLEGGGSNRIGVDLAPEGHVNPLRLLLDTGAQRSVFSPRAAREAGVSVRRLKRTPYRRDTLLGRDLEFYVDTRSSDHGARMGWEYALLGGSFLEHYVVELDFARRTVRFYDPDRYEVPESVSAAGEAVVPLEIVAGRPMVEISLDGTKLPVLLDTGSVFGLVLSGDVAEQAGISVNPAAEIRLEMIFGPVETGLGTVERLGLGPFVLEDAPALVAPDGLHNWVGRTNSLIGYDILAEFVVRLDYPRSRMWLRRVPGARRTFLGNDWDHYRRHGVLLAPVANRADAFWVMAVRSGGPVATRGVAVGDAVVGVASVAAAAEALATGPEVRVLRRGEDDQWVERELRPPARREDRLETAADTAADTPEEPPAPR